MTETAQERHQGHRCRPHQAGVRSEEEVRRGGEHPGAGRGDRPVVRFRAPHPVRERGLAARPRWRDPRQGAAALANDAGQRSDGDSTAPSLPGDLAPAISRRRPGCASTVGVAAPGAATITLDRAERRNAQTPAMWRELAAIGASAARRGAGGGGARCRPVVLGRDRPARCSRPSGVPGEDRACTAAAEPGLRRADRRLPGRRTGGCGIRRIVVGRRGAGPRHRRRVPARAGLRPAGAGRRRPARA